MSKTRLAMLLFAVSLIQIPSLLLSQSTAGVSHPDASSHRKQEAGEPAFGRAIAAQGVPELVEITPTLYKGGQPSEEGMRTLAAMGIDVVVDLREFHWTERKKVTRLGMRYVALRWFCLFPSDKVFARFLALVRENPQQKIFVHCRLGDDRVGMTIAAYRMAVEHWTAGQAMQEMRTEGFNAFHQCCICPRLARYEKSFPARYKADPLFHAPMSQVVQ